MTEAEREALRVWALAYVCGKLLYLFERSGESNRVRERLLAGLSREGSQWS